MLDKQLETIESKVCVNGSLLMYILGSRSPHYQLVLDGWGLENTVHITRHTINKKVAKLYTLCL